VLGCTHYPLLSRTISDVMGPDVVLVSSAEETAFEVRDRLQQSNGARTAAPPDIAHRFVTSGDVDQFMILGARFLGPEVESVESWRWS
jgi:glutamate racemase